MSMENFFNWMSKPVPKDEVNMVPDQLIGNLGDCHIYLDQVDGVKEQLTRQPMSLPKVTIQDGIYCSSPSDVLLKNYESHPSIKFPLSNCLLEMRWAV